MCDVLMELNGLCIIRKKFKGRGKRDNVISIGTWVLVGIRTFEKLLNGKKQRCDLLEVYNTDDQNKLKQKELHFQDKWYLFDSILDSKFTNNNNKNDETFTFEDNINYDYENQKFIESECEDENEESLHNNEDNGQNIPITNLLKQEKEEAVDINDI